jgi:hypothetical protein
MIATQEFVVPRSIPIILPMIVFLLIYEVSDDSNIGKNSVLFKG